MQTQMLRRRALGLAVASFAVVVMTSSAAYADPLGPEIDPAQFPPIAPLKISPRAPDSLPPGTITSEVDPTAARPASALQPPSVTSQAFPTRYFINAGSSGWVTLKGAPKSFMVGLGKNQWGIDVGRDDGTTSRQGYVNGSTNTGGTYGGSTVEKCLWVLNTQASVPTGGATTVTCTENGTPSLRESQYMVWFNGNRDGNCTDAVPIQCDGTPAAINGSACPGGAPVLGNVQPWRPNLGLYGDPLYWVPPEQVVRWRYATADFRFIAIRNTNSVAQGGPPQDWGFIPAVCLTDRITYIEAPRN